MAEYANPATEMSDEEKEEAIRLLLLQAGEAEVEDSLIGKAVSTVVSGYQALPDPIKTGAGIAGQGAKIVGSKFMDWIGPLAKPWGALAGVWDVAGEFPGYTLYYDEDLGRLNVKYFEDEQPQDERSYYERIQAGRKEGWDDPFSKNIGDEFSSLLSPNFLNTTTGKIVGGAIELVANIASDPLNIVGGRIASVPYNQAKNGLAWLAASRAGKATLENMPVRTVLQALNVYTGDAKKAKQLMDLLRREERGIRTLSTQEEFLLNNQLKEIAKKAGIKLDDLKAAITSEIEAGTIASGRLAKIHPEAATFAENERRIFEEILRSEGILGTTDILTPARMKELGIGGYMPHVLAKGATIGERLSAWYNRALPSGMQRQLKGTIAEINARTGRTLLLNDPVALRVLRQKWSRQALAAHRLADDAKTQLGTKLGRIEDVKGGSPRLYDEAGNRLPDDFVTIDGLDGYAFPKEGARILQDFFGNFKNPRMMPKQLDAVFRGFDAVQNWWKKYTLGLRPAWHSRNAFSNFWNNWFIGGLKNPGRYGQAAAIQKAMHVQQGFIVRGVSRLVGKVAGDVDPAAIVRGTKSKAYPKGMTRQEVYDASVKHGVYEGGFYGLDIPGQAGKASNIPFATQGRTINKAFAAGKAVENNARLALFIERLSKGDSVADAASMVRKALFDYGDLSAFEREAMKRLMPFYTWTRKNLPAQLHAILEHPDRANKINLMFGTAQEGVPKIDSEDIEKWAKDQFPIVLNADQSEGVYTFITALSYLPTAELNKVFTDPKSAVHFMAQMGTPLLKLPLEVFFNYGTFKGEAIDKLQAKGETLGFDWGQGVVKELPPKRPDETVKEYALRRLQAGSETFLGLNVTPKQKHILQSLVLLGELDRANPFNIFGVQHGEKSWAGAPRNQQDLTPAARLIRAVIGARIYQRDIGSVKGGKIMDLDRELSMLQQELERVSSIRNPAQFQHIQYLIAHALDELSKLGPVQRGTITPKR